MGYSSMRLGAVGGGVGCSDRNMVPALCGCSGEPNHGSVDNYQNGKAQGQVFDAEVRDVGSNMI